MPPLRTIKSIDYTKHWDFITEYDFLRLDQEFDIEIENDWNFCWFAFDFEDKRYLIKYLKDIRIVAMHQVGCNLTLVHFYTLSSLKDQLRLMNVPTKTTK